MNVREKLFFMALAVIILAYSAHELVIHLRPKPPSPQEIGLEWLRQEYKIPDEAYGKIARLHQDYFLRCDEMCATMKRAHRPLIQRSRNPTSREQKSAALSREKAVCENCLDNMVQHLRTVAALMPPAEGERFLADILPEVINPPELQKLRSQVTPLQ
ncbi:hypothetical protein EI77_02364 [Prosthecobacter fusiformis]|uniref:Heavy-metal resistance protein n=1 Tax=Prosthecobacter fusiformis TaxID=48464 RepID=A0A4R7RZA1_9BACT|nr:hypothetical protein [Prosthecobacter fusiformis]TDU71242.1 hypothetical protein EI77_02364 [Prosthecobacter fusiformis]